MWHLARQRPFLFAAFLLASLFAVYFAGRIVVRTIYWANPAHQNQAIEGWMTAGYIGKSWGIAAADLDAMAGLPSPQVKGHPQPLREIAQDRGIPLAIVIQEVETALHILLMQKAAKAAAP